MQTLPNAIAACNAFNLTQIGLMHGWGWGSKDRMDTVVTLVVAMMYGPSAYFLIVKNYVPYIIFSLFESK